MKILKSVVNFLSSFRLAVVLLLLLLVLTFFGTLEQVEHGIFEVQKKYFESLFLVHELFDVVPLPLPGGFLVMSLLAINLIVGGVIRMRKHWRNPGVLIIHLGMLLMLAAGFVTFQFAISGNMALKENERSDEFESFYDWNLEIAKPGESQMHVIPDSQLRGLEGGDPRTFRSDELPFVLEVDAYARNAVPMQTTPGKVGEVRNVDGFYLEPLPLDKTAERNVPGAYVTVRETESGETHEGILWGLSTQPWTVEVAGTHYAFGLARQRWDVPFTIRLDDFRRETHPGTNMDASFESDVTKIEDSTREEVRIHMNHPLRHEGYTFFQASWGRDQNGEEFSVFQVVRNPADQWPLYSCIIIGIGMLMHFGQKLIKYIRLEQKRRTA